MSGLSYTISGDASRPTILLLHGFMGSAGDWRGMLSALEEEQRCLAVDLPGHGHSHRLPPESYTMEGAAQEVCGLLDTLGIRRSALVGYSMGGRLALYLALRYPERFSALFLESASPGIESAADREARRDADEQRAARLEAGDFEEFLRDWYGQPLFASLARNEELLRQMIETRLRNDPAELARSLRGMGTGVQPPLWGELAGLRVPALAVAGELDGKFVEISDRMAAASDAVRSVVVPGVGHNVHIEAPEAYAGLLKELLHFL